MAAAAHYRNLLARHYSWMLGGDVEQLAGRDREPSRPGISAPGSARRAGWR